MRVRNPLLFSCFLVVQHIHALTTSVHGGRSLIGRRDSGNPQQQTLQAASTDIMKSAIPFVNDPDMVVTDNSITISKNGRWVVQNAAYWQLQGYVMSGIMLPDTERFNLMYNQTLFNTFSISDRELYKNVRTTFTTISEHARAFYQSTLLQFTLFADRTQIHALQLQNAFNGITKAVGSSSTASGLTDKQKKTLTYYFGIAAAEAKAALQECEAIRQQLQAFSLTTQSDKEKVAKLKVEMAKEEPELTHEATRLADKITGMKEEIAKFQAQEAKLNKEIKLWNIAIWWGPVGLIVAEVVIHHLKNELDIVHQSIATDEGILSTYTAQQRLFLAMRRDFEAMTFDATDYMNSTIAAQAIVNATTDAFQLLSDGISTLQGNLDNAEDVVDEDFFLSTTFQSQMKSAATTWGKVQTLAKQFSTSWGTTDQNGQPLSGGGSRLVVLDGNAPSTQAWLKTQGVTQWGPLQ